MYICFVGYIPEGYEVDHINDIRDDNRLENFQLLTKSENNKKSYTSGNRNVSGQRNANCKVSDIDVVNIRKSTRPNTELALIYEVSPTQIGRIKKRTQR